VGAAYPSSGGVDPLAHSRRPVRVEDHLRGLHHHLDRHSIDAELRFEPAQSLHGDLDLGEVLDLGQGDDEAVGEPPRLLNDRRDEQVQGSERPLIQLSRHRLDPDPTEW
jgi:hypothetical protein